MVDFSKLNSDKLDLNSGFGVMKDSDASSNLLLDGFNEAQLEGLNEQQSAMVKGIAEFISSKSDLDYFTVQGGGGTGKSFSIRRALQHIPKNMVIAAAPSHFAKNVLKDFLGEGYTVTTVAALLGLRLTYDSEGKEVLVPIPHKKPPITFHRIVLVDEGSMLDDDMADRILTEVRRQNKKLIILGDYCQLPPVKQDHDSKFFTQISAELTTPMRFTGAIYDLTVSVRDEINKIRDGLVPTLNVLNVKTDRVSNLQEDGGGYIFVQNTKTVIDAAIRRFKKHEGTDYVRILAYRNKTIDKLNHHIRAGLYGESPAEYEIGEIVINEGGFAVTVPGSIHKQAIINNGEIFKVSKATPFIGPYDLDCIELEFEGHTFDHPIIVLSKKGQVIYDKIMRRLTKIAKNDPSQWPGVFEIRETFARFKYSYATSIHKAQGSTIKHVFIMEDDIYAVKPTTVKEKLQSLYVAISRASFRVYIHNKNFKPQNKDINRDHLKLDCI